MFRRIMLRSKRTIYSLGAKDKFNFIWKNYIVVIVSQELKQHFSKKTLVVNFDYQAGIYSHMEIYR